MYRVILSAIIILLQLQALSQSCAPAAPVINASGSTIICEGGSVMLSVSNTGNSWTQKNDLDGIARYGAVGFSIGNKGYIGTGWNSVTRYKDFWEYDPATDAWTQKANFGNATGTARYGAMGVATATKGYIGLGNDATGFKNDFWEYDPVANTWTQKLNFIGTARANAAAFELGGIIYVGTGEDAGGNTNDFYRYNPTSNTWLIRANFPGVVRRLAVGFATSTRGYMGTGFTGLVNLSDFYEYNPTLNTWTTKTPYAGGGVRDAVAFNIGNRGYIGTGFISTARVKTFWEYNPATDVWAKRADFGGTSRTGAVGFSIGSKGYIGTGNAGAATKDFWEYEQPLTFSWTTGATTPSITANTEGFYSVRAINAECFSDWAIDVYVGISTPKAEITPGGTVNVCAGNSATLAATPGNVWAQKTNLTGNIREGAVGFNIGNKGYIGTGYNGTVNFDDLWEYDPGTDSWTQKANFSGGLRREAVGFCIGNKGYIGTGYDGTSYYNDFREYDPLTNTWANRTAFPGISRSNAVGFSIGAKGYVGTGRFNSTRLVTFYEFDPITNTWATKANYLGGARDGAVGFGIGTKGYLGTGWNGTTRYNDFYEYDPVADSWTIRTALPGVVRNKAVGFSLGNTRGYIGTGWNGATFFNDFYEFDPVANNWTIKANFIGLARESSVGFGIGNKGYIGTGYTGAARLGNFYEYDPGYSYSWSSGQTTQTISAGIAGSYAVTITDIFGCFDTSLATVLKIDTVKATINPGGTVNICSGNSINLSAPLGNNWISKANFGGSARGQAVGFSVGNKGYLCGGRIVNTFLNDFWEYDPVTNVWTQKANFGGGTRAGAVGFSIGNNGYIGTGYNNISTLYNDFWEYNPSNNAWIQKANFGGTARAYAVGLSIGTKGYVGTGSGSSIYYNDFWEYDPVTNAWSPKADFAGTVRRFAVGFGIGNKGYIGTGEYGSTSLIDFWQYDPVTNAWTQKANFGGGTRAGAAGFSIGNKGFIGTGNSGISNFKDFWQYDPVTNTWTQKDDFGGSARTQAVGFCIGSKGYISGSGNTIDFWEYSPDYSYSWSTGQTTQTISAATAGSYAVNLTDILGCDAISVATIIKVDTPKATINPGGTVSVCAGDSVTLSAPASDVWIQKANVGGVVRNRAVGFSIGNKGYIGTGRNGLTNLNDFWEYDLISNVWTQKQNFINSRIGAVGFSIGNKGYIGTGSSGSNIYDDFWEYDPVFNQWNQKANVGGGLRGNAVGFSIGNRGYIGTGSDGAYKNDFWEYNPVLNQWNQKANFGGGFRDNAVGFSIGNRGFMGTGYDGAYKNDFWEYDPVLNQWNQKANFDGTARSEAVGFSIGNNGYIGTGMAGSSPPTLNDFWEYDPLLNRWIQKANFGGTARREAVGFSIGNKGYIGTGGIDFWEYDPGYNYTWSSGQTTQTINTDTAGTYTLALTNILGCTATSSPTIVNVNTTNTWAGGGSNNWNTAANWSCGTVPNNPKITAVITNGAVPMPVMTADVLVKGLQLNGTSIVDLNGRTLTINGVITGMGTLKGSSTSNLVIKGAAGTLNFTPGSQILKDLLLTDTASATLGTVLNITAGTSPGSVTVNTSAVLNTGGNLTLKSDINGTSRVGTLTGSIVGDVTVERFINTGTAIGQHPKSWQLLATPANGQNIRQAWQENGTTPAGLGTLITGTGTGFDITTTSSSIKTYNDVANTWNNLNSTNNALLQKNGYMILVRGDRTVTTSTAPANNTTLRSKGTIYQPNNPPPSIPVLANKFQSFGNPYASRIEFSKVRAASSGINDVFYVWDPMLTGNYGLGGFQAITGVSGYVPSVGSSFYPAGVPVPFIESGQAVMVQAGASGGTIQFNEGVKATGSRLVHRGFPPQRNSVLYTRLLTQSGAPADGNMVIFDPLYSNEVDPFDAEKIMNGGENLGISRNQKILSVEAHDRIIDNDTIFYDLRNARHQPYQLQFIPQHLQQVHKAYLLDAYHHSSTEISVRDTTVVAFIVNNDPSSYASNRFALVFKSKKIPAQIVDSSTENNSTPFANNLLQPAKASVNIFPNPLNEKNLTVQLYQMNKPFVTAELYSVTGNKICTFPFNSNELTIPSTYFTASGTYVLKIMHKDQCLFTEKIIAVLP